MSNTDPRWLVTLESRTTKARTLCIMRAPNLLVAIKRATIDPRWTATHQPVRIARAEPTYRTEGIANDA